MFLDTVQLCAYLNIILTHLLLPLPYGTRQTSRHCQWMKKILQASPLLGQFRCNISEHVRHGFLILVDIFLRKWVKIKCCLFWLLETVKLLVKTDSPSALYRKAVKLVGTRKKKSHFIKNENEIDEFINKFFNLTYALYKYKYFWYSAHSV